MATTAHHIDEQGRGVEAITAFAISPRFAGFAVHDACAGTTTARPRPQG